MQTRIQTKWRGGGALLWVVAVAITLVGLGVGVASAASEETDVEGARVPVSPRTAGAAFQQAMRYVEVVHHTPEGEPEEGVLYHLGGQDTVEVFLRKVINGQTAEAGIDASGLVVNAYRAVLPGIEFWWNVDGSEKRSDAASSTLFHYNVQPVELEALHEGDLLFFGSGPDRVNGVALFHEVRDGVVRFISASASQGRVVETGASLSGAYWNQNFVGAGRLLVAPTLVPSS